MTIKDIARESGYSVGTVSRALNDMPGVSSKAKKRILEVVDKYNFKLNTNAKHLKQTSKDGIAILIKGTQNMLFASIVEQLQKQIKAQGFASSIYYFDEEVNEIEEAILIIKERNPLGILFLGSNLEYFQEDFKKIKIPCVLVTNSAEMLGYENLSSVTTNDAAAAKYAIEHLIDLGHKKIGILGGYKEESYAAFKRYEGCMEAFRDRKLAFDSKRQYVEAFFNIQDGYQAMEKLLDQAPDITAVFAMSDVMAIGAMRAIFDRGMKIPEDISIIGFDGIDMVDYFWPRLTTIRQHREILAQRSVEILLSNLDRGVAPIHEVEPFHLIPGESVIKR